MMLSKNKISPLKVAAVSSGGVVAALAGAGMHSAWQMAGLKEPALYFGVSGGAIVSALRAVGKTPKELLHLCIEEDFSTLLSRKGGAPRNLRGKKRLANLLLRRDPDSILQEAMDSDILDEEEKGSFNGFLSTAQLGQYINEIARSSGCSDGWPNKFCTMATLGNGSQVAFNKDGVFLIDTEDKKTCLSSKPPPLAMALRYTVTIPGIMAGQKYGDQYLFDGALSRDGFCPVGMLIRHFGANPPEILACRIGDDAAHYILGPTLRMVRRLWLPHPQFHWGPETHGVLEMRPPVDHIYSLKLKLSPDEKWLAVLIAFQSALRTIALSGHLPEKRRRAAMELFASLGHWRDILPAQKDAKQLLADRAEQVFTEHGLY